MRQCVENIAYFEVKDLQEEWRHYRVDQMFTFLASIIIVFPKSWTTWHCTVILIQYRYPSQTLGLL